MKKGFSLIELVVGITVVAVVSLIGLTTFNNTQSKTRDGLRKNDLVRLALALELYAQSNSNAYIDSTPGVEGNCSNSDTTTFYHPTNGIAPFMSNNTVPKDPQTNANYCYVSVNNGRSFRLFTRLEIATDANITCTPPTYNYSVVSDDITASCPP